MNQLQKILIILVLFSFAALPALANGDHADLSIEGTLQDIMTSQNATSADDLDCDQITDSQFEVLGDAVMEDIHPGEAHEQMDAMMGGEGSESLEAMHINMGRNYLGCNDGSYGGPGMGMMGDRGMMWSDDGGNWLNQSGNYMMRAPFGGYGSYIWTINAILFTVLLVVLIRYFWKKSK